MEILLTLGAAAATVYALSSMEPKEAQGVRDEPTLQHFQSQKRPIDQQTTSSITVDRDIVHGLPVAFIHRPYGGGNGLADMVFLMDGQMPPRPETNKH